MDNPSISQVRACLTSADPWGLTNVTNGATLYIEPIFGRRIGLWNGTSTDVARVTSLSLSLSGKTAQNYRLYVWDSNADFLIDSAELVAWTNNTTPPADTLIADGYLVKTGATGRRAIADIMLHATAQCDWRDARRGICHIDERSRRAAILTALPQDNSWAVPKNMTNWRLITGGSGTIGQHFVEFILSNTTLVSAESIVLVDRAAGTGNYQYEFGFGLDTVTSNSAIQSFGHDEGIGNVQTSTAISNYKANTSQGKHTLNIIEKNATGRDVTAYGDNGGSVFKSGMLVEIML